MRAVLVLILLVLGACVSDKDYARSKHGDAESLVAYAQSLIGTPYKYGGHSPDSGFDCSGFVSHVFSHTLDINLPRNTAEISTQGKAVRSNELRAGDLVFFNTLHTRFSHVGIYLGDFRFIHAPSSGGSVRIENMRDRYWRRSYNGARRITLLN